MGSGAPRCFGNVFLVTHQMFKQRFVCPFRFVFLPNFLLHLLQLLLGRLLALGQLKPFRRRLRLGVGVQRHEQAGRQGLHGLPLRQPGQFVPLVGGFRVGPSGSSNEIEGVLWLFFYSWRLVSETTKNFECDSSNQGFEEEAFA